MSNSSVVFLISVHEMKSESEDSESKRIVKEESQSGDEGNSGGSSSGGGQVLKKGPWTSAEDAILVDYVQKHGEGNWNAVQKHSGLSRCGKSCRLRWANHLRPNLKKGAFTLEEEDLIIDLHSRIGNKWARMASQLPGRTDNEIKNFWNTRIKRCQRAGLPVYPPNVSRQASDENQINSGIPEYGCGNKQQNELFHGNIFEFPVPLDSFDPYNSALSFPLLPVPDISFSRLNQECVSQNYASLTPVMNRVKMLKDAETFAPSIYSHFPTGLPFLEQLSMEPSRKIQRTCCFDYPYDPDPESGPPFVDPIASGHGFINSNLSASGPFPEPVKLELPSLQYNETNESNWFTCPQSPPIDMIDTFIDHPIETFSLQPECLSPHNSGLLDSLLHEAQTKKHTFEKSLSSSVVTPNEMVENSNVNIADPISPLACSAATILSECTPISSNSGTESAPPKNYPGSKDILFSTEILSPKTEKRDLSPYSDGVRPVALFESSWAENDVPQDIDVLLDPDFEENCKNVSGETLSNSPREVSLETYPWHNIPHACQMSELS